MKLSRRTSWYTRSTSRSAPVRLPLGGRLLVNGLLPAGQILGALAQYHLPGCDLRLLLEPPLPLLKPGLLLPKTTLTFCHLLLQAPLLRRHGLLMTGGVDQGQLHLLALAPEFLLTRLEITFPGRLPGGR